MCVCVWWVQGVAPVQLCRVHDCVCCLCQLRVECVFVHVCMHACMHVCTCMCVSVCGGVSAACVLACEPACVCVCVFAYRLQERQAPKAYSN